MDRIMGRDAGAGECILAYIPSDIASNAGLGHCCCMSLGDGVLLILQGVKGAFVAVFMPMWSP